MEMNEKTRLKWDEWYQLASWYYKEHNTIEISRPELKSEHQLKTWIKNQKSKYSKSLLKPEQIEKLEKIGIQWPVSITNENNPKNWQGWFELAIDYYHEHGCLDMSNVYQTEHGIKLGSWVANQRTHYKNGKLTDKQIELLNSIGMIWQHYEVNKDNPKSWNGWYQHLCEYHKKNGNIKVPKRYITEDNLRLGNWVLTQRQLYKENKLSKKRIDDLNKLGMEWETESFNQTSFPEQVFLYYINQNFDEIVNRGNRDIKMEADILIEDHNIVVEYDGRWHIDREERDVEKNLYYLNNGYTVIRIRDGKNQSLIEMTNSNKYYEINDNNVFESVDIEGINALVNRVLDLLSELTKVDIISYADITQDADEIYSYTNNNQNWEKWYQTAVDYYEKNGNLLVPFSYMTKDGKNLGQWISNQRQNYKKERVRRLTKEQIQKLEMIGMVWVVMMINKENPSTWDDWYHIAKSYYQNNHHLRIVRTYQTEEGYKLGDWIHNQRKKRCEATLPDECIKQLNEIGMIWNDTEQRWQMNYQSAKKYYELSGHLKVPVGYKTEDGLALGKWISHQREKYLKHKLSQAYVAQLEEIGMIWRVRKD